MEESDNNNELMVPKSVIRLVWIITNCILLFYAAGLIIYNKWFHKEFSFHNKTTAEKVKQRSGSGPYGETLIQGKQSASI